jgi:hypothetical protein
VKSFNLETPRRIIGRPIILPQDQPATLPTKAQSLIQAVSWLGATTPTRKRTPWPRLSILTKTPPHLKPWQRNVRAGEMGEVISHFYNQNNILGTRE